MPSLPVCRAYKREKGLTAAPPQSGLAAIIKVAFLVLRAVRARAGGMCAAGCVVQMAQRVQHAPQYQNIRPPEYAAKTRSARHGYIVHPAGAPAAWAALGMHAYYPAWMRPAGHIGLQAAWKQRMWHGMQKVHAEYAAKTRSARHGYIVHAAGAPAAWAALGMHGYYPI